MSTLVIVQVCSYLKWKEREHVIPLSLSFLKGLTSLQKIETSILETITSVAVHKSVCKDNLASI
jgi:hypothetical protein